MTIGHPATLLGILILIPVIFLQLRGFLKGRIEIIRLGAQWPEEQVSKLYTVKTFFTALGFDLFLVFSVLALADVTWGERPVEEDRAGLDVAIVVDVSRSMLAADADPSRLARSLSVIRAVVRQLPVARTALIAFKGDAITLMPLTEDANALEIVLDGVGPTLISTPGTNVARGLDEAMRSFPEATFAHRAIVLFSDGESLTGDTEQPLATLVRRGIPVMAVLAGTAEGAPVPAGDGTTLLDEDGKPVISRSNPALLADIADRTDGALLQLNEPNIVEDLATRLTSFVTLREKEGFRLVAVRRYRLFLTLAVLSLLISISVRVVRWRGMF